MTPFAQWIESRDSLAALPVDTQESEEGLSLLSDIEAALTETIAFQNELHFRQQMEMERQEWMQSHAVESQGRYQAEMAALVDTLGSSVSDVITPLLEDNIKRKGVEDFCSIIKKHLGSGRTEELKIRSPRDLVPLVAEGMKRNGFDGVVEETDEPELHTMIGATEIQTELSNWVNDLRSLVAR